ncbi:MAG: 1-(5-phosphoribosyl)-5-[(5-phosphoribosylamino)methylideneamino]imidazole-4-carboxamide isomerase [Planctomycetota bacterium]
MSAFELIPAVDIRGGRCVRLEQGLADRETVYEADPLEAALRWQAAGARRLHVVDLDGAFGGEPVNFDAVARIMDAVDMCVEVGGGIRDAELAGRYLDAGAGWVIFGTRAAEDPSAFAAAAERFPGQVILGLDCRDGKVRTSGWTSQVEKTAAGLLGELSGAPLAAVIFTDTRRDGMLEGPNFDSLEEVAAESPWPVIASGGVTTLEQVKRLAGMKLAGAIVGQALYKGRLDLAEALRAAAEARGGGEE